MRTSLAVFAATSLIGTIAAGSPIQAAAAADCSTPPAIVNSTIAPRTLVLGVSQFKGIVVTVKVRTNGCTVHRVEVGLYGPDFVDTYDLHKVDTTSGVTTYDTGLRITPGDLPNSETGTWSSFVTVWGQRTVEAPGPNFKLLRASRLTTNAGPEPVVRGHVITVKGRLTRADWDSLTYRGYGKRKVELPLRLCRQHDHVDGDQPG